MTTPSPHHDENALPAGLLVGGARRRRKAPEVNRDTIRAALEKTARIIEAHGEAYLPIFLRLEDELRKHDKTEDALARVRNMATRKD